MSVIIDISWSLTVALSSLTLESSLVEEHVASLLTPPTPPPPPPSLNRTALGLVLGTGDRECLKQKEKEIK